MATTKTYNPDTDQFEYVSDGHIILTAPEHHGEITLPDGTVLDVTPHAVEVPSQLHAIQAAVLLAGNDASVVTQEHVDAHNDVAAEHVEHTEEQQALADELAPLLVPADTEEVAE
jgi:hypothetical protein